MIAYIFAITAVLVALVLGHSVESFEDLPKRKSRRKRKSRGKKRKGKGKRKGDRKGSGAKLQDKGRDSVVKGSKVTQKKGTTLKGLGTKTRNKDGLANVSALPPVKGLGTKTQNKDGLVSAANPLKSWGSKLKFDTKTRNKDGLANVSALPPVKGLETQNKDGLVGAANPLKSWGSKLKFDTKTRNKDGLANVSALPPVKGLGTRNKDGLVGATNPLKSRGSKLKFDTKTRNKDGLVDAAALPSGDLVSGDVTTGVEVDSSSMASSTGGLLPSKKSASWGHKTGWAGWGHMHKYADPKWGKKYGSASWGHKNRDGKWGQKVGYKPWKGWRGKSSRIPDTTTAYVTSEDGTTSEDTVSTDTSTGTSTSTAKYISDYKAGRKVNMTSASYKLGYDNLMNGTKLAPSARDANFNLNDYNYGDLAARRVLAANSGAKFNTAKTGGKDSREYKAAYDSQMAQLNSPYKSSRNPDYGVDKNQDYLAGLQDASRAYFAAHPSENAFTQLQKPDYKNPTTAQEAPTPAPAPVPTSVAVPDSVPAVEPDSGSGILDAFLNFGKGKVANEFTMGFH